MTPSAVLVATCLASFFGTMVMGLNAFFAYTVVNNMGYSWQTALFVIFIEGLVFIFLTAFNIRNLVYQAFPSSIKYAITIGIGLFIAFIGFQNAGICVQNPDTLVSVVDFTKDFHGKGIMALLAIIGTLMTFALHLNKVKFAVIIGIFGTWILGIFCQLIGVYVPDVSKGLYSLYPVFEFHGVTNLT